MNTDWMGRYRPLVAELVRHSNITQQTIKTKAVLDDEISLNSQEWQVFEYIIEHADDASYMNIISTQLGIPQSSFSKIVKILCGYGLVDKYQTVNNRKNIILCPSEKGLALYERHSSQVISNTFSAFFKKLDSFSDGQIKDIIEALKILNAQLAAGNKHDTEVALIKKDP